MIFVGSNGVYNIEILVYFELKILFYRRVMNGAVDIDEANGIVLKSVSIKNSK